MKVVNTRGYCSYTMILATATFLRRHVPVLRGPCSWFTFLFRYLNFFIPDPLIFEFLEILWKRSIFQNRICKTEEFFRLLIVGDSYKKCERTFNFVPDSFRSDCKNHKNRNHFYLNDKILTVTNGQGVLVQFKHVCPKNCRALKNRKQNCMCLWGDEGDPWCFVVIFLMAEVFLASLLDTCSTYKLNVLTFIRKKFLKMFYIITLMWSLNKNSKSFREIKFPVACKISFSGVPC